jgi:formate dehydrogenase accessory protein FdhD
MSATPENSLAQVRALRVQADARVERDEAVVVEAPIALLYNGEPFTVMMATPGDLEDFALGFALSEGIVAAPSEFRLVDVVHGADGVALHAAIPQARHDALAQRRRSLEGRSGCGLCGVETLQDALRPVPGVTNAATVSRAHIAATLALLAEHQPLNARSGGVHAAAFAHPGGLLVREDVGRHNALDKLIGARHHARWGDDAGGFIVMTSRASVELVHKAVIAGAGALATVSAPTGLAARLAAERGLVLLGFVRDERATRYA